MGRGRQREQVPEVQTVAVGVALALQYHAERLNTVQAKFQAPEKTDDVPSSEQHRRRLQVCPLASSEV